MRVTRRFWTAAGSVAILGLLAAVTGERALFVGTALLGSWLVGSAYAFVIATQRATSIISVEVSIAPATIQTETETTVAVTATRSGADSLPVTVKCALPPAAERIDGTPTFTPEGDTERATVILSMPIAGTFEVGPCQLTATDSHGLFETTVPVAASADLTVRPRRPRNVHVGEGGQQVGAAYGEHDSRRGSAGLEPTELRQYVPGDPTSHIDWNATARLNEAYVREFEAQVNRETLLAVDHRATMGAGPRGETKLDYGRELALAVVDSADALTDPLGLVTVGDEGETARYESTAADAGYQRARTRLGDLRPTDGTKSRGDPRDPGETRRVADRLATEDSPMAEALRPLFTDSEAYVRRVQDEPLLRAVGTAIDQGSRIEFTVIVTDDTGRTELTRMARLLQRRDIQAIFYLLPSALYDPGGLADLETAYTSYVDFEEFRQSLAQTRGISAFEVAPSDRLAAVLSAGRESRPEVSPE